MRNVFCTVILMALPVGSVMAGDGEMDSQSPPMMVEMLSRAGVAADNASLLRAASQSKDPLVRSLALDLLGMRNVEAVAAVGRRILETEGEDPQVREAAATALARLGEPEGVEVLERLLESSPTRVSIARRLAEMGNIAGYSVVVEELDREPSVLAIEALAVFVPLAEEHHLDAAARLLALADDEDVEVRRTAVLQLGILGGRGAAPEGARALVERIATDDLDEQVRATARYVLESWSPSAKGEA